MAQAREYLRRWFDESIRGEHCEWSDDREVLAWMANSSEYLDSNITRLRRELVSEEVCSRD